MNQRGEKLQRARLLLTALAGLDVSDPERLNISQLAELSREYDALSTDHDIKDQFRRMEQSVSIPPVVFRYLNEAKTSPSQVVAEQTRALDAQERQAQEFQKLREEYDAMSDYDKKNMSIEDFRKYYKVDSKVIIDNPDRFKEEASRNPTMIYEATYYNGRQIKVFEVSENESEELLRRARNLLHKAELTHANSTQTVFNMYTCLIRNGKTDEEARRILNQEFENHLLHRRILAERTPAEWRAYCERAKQEGHLSNDELRQTLRRLKANTNNQNRQWIRIQEERDLLTKQIGNISDIAKATEDVGRKLGDEEVVASVQRGQKFRDQAKQLCNNPIILDNYNPQDIGRKPVSDALGQSYGGPTTLLYSMDPYNYRNPAIEESRFRNALGQSDGASTTLLNSIVQTDFRQDIGRDHVRDVLDQSYDGSTTLLNSMLQTDFKQDIEESRFRDTLNQSHGDPTTLLNSIDPTDSIPTASERFLQESFKRRALQQYDILNDIMDPDALARVHDAFNDERNKELDNERLRLYNHAFVGMVNSIKSTAPAEEMAQNAARLKAAITEMKNSSALSPEIMQQVEKVESLIDGAALEILPETQHAEYQARLQEALPQQTALVQDEINKRREQFDNNLISMVQSVVKENRDRNYMIQTDLSQSTQEKVLAHAAQALEVNQAQAINHLNQYLAEMHDEAISQQMQDTIDNVSDIEIDTSDFEEDGTSTSFMPDAFSIGSLDGSDEFSTDESEMGLDEEYDDQSLDNTDIALGEQEEDQNFNDTDLALGEQEETNDQEELSVIEIDPNKANIDLEVNPNMAINEENNEEENTQLAQNEEVQDPSLMNQAPTSAFETETDRQNNLAQGRAGALAALEQNSLSEEQSSTLASLDQNSQRVQGGMNMPQPTNITSGMRMG